MYQVRHDRYIACSGLPLKNMVRRVNPPRLAIQRRNGPGYIKYSIRVAPAFVTGRPRGPISQAAWKPNSAREVTQILLEGKLAKTIVQADAQKPSIITVWPEARSRSYL